MRDYNSKKPTQGGASERKPSNRSSKSHHKGNGKYYGQKKKASKQGGTKPAEKNALAVEKKPVPKHKPQQKKKSHSHNQKMAENLKVIPIGGLSEIGKNMTLLEYKDQILIIDCGLSFPEDGMYGIDVVIPDFSYVVKNADKIAGMVITHGHEDHIGAIPYLLKQISVPIYGTRLTLGLIENELKEHNLTGDFKVDFTPIDGEPIDLLKFAEIGRKGVDLMLADSTNVLRPGHTESEQLVGQTLDGIFRKAENRIIIATFSSNVHRVQKIIELAIKYGRKFAVSGRSMENVVKLAVELGYLEIPAGAFVDLNKTKNIPDKELVIITTGSQGEPMAALSRMANNEHRNVKLKQGDMVIFSSTPVPGNEKTVSSVVNKLYEKGVDVIYNDIADIHVSGHACQEELKLIHSLIKPKFFMPVHGEYRHLIRHAQLAQDLGMKKDHIFILSNGDQLTVDKRKAIKFNEVVSAEDVLVDGLGVGDVGNIVLRDRKLLSESGIIILVAAIDKEANTLVSGPDIVSRGFVYVRENEDLINQARKIAEDVIWESLDNESRDWNGIKNNVRDEVRKFIFKKTKRNPVILPIFMDV